MSGYGTLPTDESHTPIILPGSTGPRPAKWRFELGELLESKRAHWTVLFLVCLDAVAVLTEIIIELFEECGSDSGHAIVEEWVLEFLASISIIVASLFVLECIASLIAFGPRFYLPGYPHWFLHSLDFVGELGLRSGWRNFTG
ncbi:hypothetical protein BC938DRAFT_482285 [Jimgerdemannia flammicorona]|uniref:Hydrogen voltage-gated channel 1 n=1 Tax=Jimgerdemannia flammicorona TaxID=994334 RepID=A0A433QEF8_9FUNG|nr:hypothetical protein BC938DRAFT_482285 [Jimgerdemannia flammicorona]